MGQDTIESLRRELEIVRTELKASFGDLKALVPYLPEGWSVYNDPEFSGHWVNGNAHVYTDGEWTLFRGMRNSITGSEDSLLEAMRVAGLAQSRELSGVVVETRNFGDLRNISVTRGRNEAKGSFLTDREIKREVMAAVPNGTVVYLTWEMRVFLRALDRICENIADPLDHEDRSLVEWNRSAHEAELEKRIEKAKAAYPAKVPKKWEKVPTRDEKLIEWLDYWLGDDSEDL